MLTNEERRGSVLRAALLLGLRAAPVFLALYCVLWPFLESDTCHGLRHATARIAAGAAEVVGQSVTLVDEVYIRKADGATAWVAPSCMASPFLSAILAVVLCCRVRWSRRVVCVALAVLAWFTLNSLRICTTTIALDRTRQAFVVVHDLIWPAVWGGLAGLTLLAASLRDLKGRSRQEPAAPGPRVADHAGPP